MSDTFKTLTIPDDCVELARQLCALEAGGAGMFTTGLSADGKEPATHYISTGWCPPLIAKFTPLQVWEWQQPDPEQPGAWVQTGSEPGNPVAVYEAAQQPIPGSDPPEPQVPCTLSDIEALFTDSDITQQEPFVAMGRMGLVIVQPEEPAPEPEEPIVDPEPVPDPIPPTP